MSEWISVVDRLPPEHENVLVTDGDIVESEYIHITWDSNESFWIINHTDDVYSMDNKGQVWNVISVKSFSLREQETIIF